MDLSNQEQVAKFCNERPATLQMRYTNGKWQAQLATYDGTWSAMAYEEDIEQLFAVLAESARTAR
jgi:formylmethanofuran dehydrogenase subunit B